MNIQHTLEQESRVEDFQRRHKIRLLTLLFTDIVGSTKLKQRAGERAAIALIERHHALLRELLAGFTDAEEIGTGGDSFFMVFAKPSDAVQFALQAQRVLRKLARETAQPVFDRIGIHVGEVFIQDRGSERHNLFGSQIDSTARIMSLGEGDQILLSRFAFDNARLVLSDFEIPGIGELSWLNHGYYELKGVEEAIEVCEVGEAGLAALAPPGDSEKAHRFYAADAEPVLGWRPAAGQLVPETRWKLVRPLGEGGFGEVWLAQHEMLKQQRVLKFCFKTERVRALKREATLFRVLRERFGEHPHIVAIHDVSFESPPFYLVMDFVDGPSLESWTGAHATLAEVPLEHRLELVAQVADALQAAHNSGIIHRDLKPSNILIADPVGSPPSAKLVDFGIGQIVNADALARVTKLGFTQTMFRTGVGTPVYQAPELDAGQPATIRSDIYALGVVLWQIVIAQFTRPLATDWPDEIADSLLLEDIRLCVAGDPNRRFAAAGELAVRLRALPERRRAAAEEKARRAHLERLAYRRGVVQTSAVAVCIVAAVAGLAVYALRQTGAANMEKRRADVERGNADEARQRAEAEEEKGAELLKAASRADYATAMSFWRFERRKRLAYLGRALRFWKENELARFAVWDGIVNGAEDIAPLPVWSIHEKGTVYSVAISPDGKRLVTGSEGPDPQLWDMESGKALLALRGHSDFVFAVAFSPDGKLILTGSADCTAKLWDARSGKELLTLKKGRQTVSSVAFSPDSRRLLTSSDDGTAKLWNADSGTEILTVRGHSLFGVDVAFSPDGKHLLTGSWDHTARLWDAGSGQELLVMKGHSEWIKSVAFSPDGRQILTGSGDLTAKLWDAKSGKELLTLKEASFVNAVAFSPDGRRLLTGCEDGHATLWDAQEGKKLLTFEGNTPVNSVAFSPDGRRILSGSNLVTLWNAQTDNGMLKFAGHPGHNVWSLAFSRDGAFLLTGSDDKTAKLWDAKSGREIYTLKGHDGIVVSVALSSDGLRLLTGSEDKTAKIWDASTGKELFTLQGHSDDVMSVAFSPDDTRLLTGSDDNTAKLWSAESAKELHTLGGHSDSVNSVAFSPDGKHLLTGSADKTAKLWDAESGLELLTFRGHTKGIYTTAFSPDGKRVLTGGEDKTVRLWDSDTGKELLILKGHNGAVRVIGAPFSADGQYLLTADKNAKLWEAQSGKLLGEIRSPRGGIFVASLAPDGTVIAVGGVRALSEVAVPGLLGPAPDWLEVALAVETGFEFSEEGILAVVPLERRVELRDRLPRSTADRGGWDGVLNVLRR